MSFYLTPIGNGFQYFSNGAVPLAGGKLWTYAPGTTTPVATYTTSLGSVPNANPIILDSGGRVPQEIWIAGGAGIKFLLQDASGNPIPNGVWDNLYGIGDPLSPGSTGVGPEWLAQSTPTYISTTSFSVPGNQTGIFDANRRVRTQNTGGIALSAVASSSFGAGITTVTIVNDSTTLDSGLSAVWVGILDPGANSIGVAIGGSFTGAPTITTTTGLTPVNIGQLITINGAATVSLPAAAIIPAGRAISFRGTNASAAVAAQGSDVLIVNGMTSVAAGSFALGISGDSCTFISNGSNAWTASAINRAPSTVEYASGSGTDAYPFGTKYLKVFGKGPGGGGGGCGASGATNGTAGASSTTYSTYSATSGGGGSAGTGGGPGGGGSGGGTSGSPTYSRGGQSGLGGLLVGTGAAQTSPTMGGGGSGAAGATSSGAGGAGGASGGATTFAGGSGGEGGEFTVFIFNPPAAGLAYNVGPGGTGGSAGTGGNAGQSGGGGRVDREAYF